MKLHKMNNLSVLLIEDSPSDAELLQAKLEDVDDVSFQIEHASDLQSGIQSLNAKPCDAVILDLGLPDSFGLPTYETFRNKFPHVPVIILSGNDDRELATEALRKGADNYLLKDTANGNRVAIAILASIGNRMRDKPDA